MRHPVFDPKMRRPAGHWSVYCNIRLTSNTRQELLCEHDSGKMKGFLCRESSTIRTFHLGRATASPDWTRKRTDGLPRSNQMVVARCRVLLNRGHVKPWDGDPTSRRWDVQLNIAHLAVAVVGRPRSQVPLLEHEWRMDKELSGTGPSTAPDSHPNARPFTGPSIWCINEQQSDKCSVYCLPLKKYFSTSADL